MAEWLNGGNGYIRTIYGRHTHTDDTDDDDDDDTLIFYNIDEILLRSGNDQRSCYAPVTHRKAIP